MKLNNFKNIFPHLLNVVCEAGEAEAGDDEDEDQEAELPGALAQREDDGLQTPGVSGDRTEVIIGGQLQESKWHGLLLIFIL